MDCGVMIAGEIVGVLIENRISSDVHGIYACLSTFENNVSNE